MDILSGEQITAAGLTDWRKLGQGLHARFVIGDFGAGIGFLTAIADAGASARHYPEVRMGTAHVDLKLISDDAIYRDDAGTEAQGRGTIGDDVRDATSRVPILWFQDTEPHPTPRQRFHIDVQVPYDVAEERIAAAVAAGAVIVDESQAPSTTIIADPDGNKACVGTFQPATAQE
jgi:4a-hydroxytetrahydrobiopterin dehydratase